MARPHASTPERIPVSTTCPSGATTATSRPIMGSMSKYSESTGASGPAAGRADMAAAHASTRATTASRIAQASSRLGSRCEGRSSPSEMGASGGTAAERPADTAVCKLFSATGATLRPMPATAKAPSALERASTRMPASFRSNGAPSPALATTSLGHLMPTRPPKPSARRASKTPMLTTAGSATKKPMGTDGLRTTDRYKPPACDDQALPRRPRPSVCSDATTAQPWGAPPRALSVAMSLVEATLP